MAGLIFLLFTNTNYISFDGFFCLIFWFIYITSNYEKENRPNTSIFCPPPPMNDKKSHHIGSLASNPFVLVKNPSPSFITLNGTHRLISGVQWLPGYNYSPHQIAPLVRFSYLMFPLFQSSSGCFHLGLFLFREQIPLLLFSHHFHFRFFQPLWKWKRHVHSENTKAIKYD